MKRLKVFVWIKALLIFGGIIVTQMISYMICTIGYLMVYFWDSKDYSVAFARLSEAVIKDSQFLMWISAVSAALSFVWCGILYYKSNLRVRQMNYRKIFTIRNIFNILSTAIGTCIIVTVLLSLISALFPQLFNGYSKVMSNFDTTSFGITMIYVIFIGPVSEEMIFRGALLDRFHLGFSFWYANIFQAALFGIYHMNIIQGLYAFCLGILLGMIVYSTGSILCSMLAHILFNSTTYMLQAALSTGSALINKIVIGIMLIISVLALLGVRYFVKMSNRKMQVDEQ